MNKISIILPVYNSEKYIDRCIRSIVNQRYKNFELIIINDGSTDNSLDVLKKWCKVEKRIHLIDKENEGVSKARNLGLEKASGNYIAFIDSDDYYSSEMLSMMVEIGNKENADIVESSFNLVKDGEIFDQCILQDEVLNKSEPILTNFLKRANSANAIWNKLYRATLFEKNRYPNYSYGEDYYLNALVHSESNKKVTISNPLYNYENNEDSVMNKKFNMKKLDNIYSRVEIFQIFEKKIGNNRVLSLIALDILSTIIIAEVELYDFRTSKIYDEAHVKLVDLFKKYKKYVPNSLIYDLKTKFMYFLIQVYGSNKKIFELALFCREIVKRRE